MYDVSELKILLVMLLNNSPMLLTAIVGAIMAMVLWQRAPRAAMLLLIACLIELMISLANTWVYGWYVPRTTHDESYTAVRGFITVWGVLSGLLRVFGFALLIWAVFTGRPRPNAGMRPPPLP
ncbi:hypothetical protein [Dyella tabacisoli]|uniref:Uncharacterized protein n=1 Tax=Dyella tabacisoli TaxID=2282381 RepID=A0A369US45_9GAMM|nr:hypothetical protein [Dyella tabacisoli]RDD82450.1 hypothetical protein DVJ77_05750 [Dyella tabacisoli]